jgi:hypothetical protein
MRPTEEEYEEFRARLSLRLIRKGVLAFYFEDLPMRMKRSMTQRTMEGTTFAIIATLVVIVAVGLGLLMFHFSDSQDLLAQWLRSLTM